MKTVELKIRTDHFGFAKIKEFSLLSGKLEAVKLTFVEAMSFSSKIYSFKDLVKKYGETAILKENEYYDGKIAFVVYPNRVTVADMIGTIKKLENPPRKPAEGESFWFCDGTLRGCIQLLNMDYVSHAEGNKDLKMSREMLQEIGVEIKGKLYKAMWDGTNRLSLEKTVFDEIFYKAFDYSENGKVKNDFNKYFEIIGKE